MEAFLGLDRLPGGLAVTTRYLLGLVFLIAGLSKLTRDGTARRLVIEAYGIAPRSLTPSIAASLPWIEVAIGAGLLTGALESGPLFAGSIALVVFTAAAAFNLVRGRRDLDCGCFGGTGERLGWRVVVRNVLLILAAIASMTQSGEPVWRSWDHATALVAASMVLGTAAMIGTIATWRTLPHLEEVARESTPRDTHIRSSVGGDISA